MDTGDPPTVQPLARDYQEQLERGAAGGDRPEGQVLAEAGDLDIAAGAIGALPEIQQALAGRETGGFWPHPDGVLQVVTVPIASASTARRSWGR